VAEPPTQTTLEQEANERAVRADPDTVERVREWAKKLIDLTKRNRLLYYRETKRTTLAFRSPGPDAILWRLLDGKSWLFYEPPAIPPGRPGFPTVVTPLDDVLRSRPRADRELVTTQRDPSEFAKSLEAIERKARLEFEDRGTHVLHLAWGLARWTDVKTGDEIAAPVVLVPVNLRRPSVRERFELVPATDDDPVVNPALRVKLETDQGRPMPDLDPADIGPADLLAQVGRRLPEDGRIDPYAAIGIFSFAKEAIYRDLVDHAAIVAEHPLIRSIAQGHLVDEVNAAQVPTPHEEDLDREQAPADSFEIVDSDSSQRRAIEAAKRGTSFVLVGPPGTGKSQTIANIIAEFIGRGKSVLFVSQKIAALEVVAERLERAEIRDLVLELHSAKASRSEVSRALAAALDSHPEDRAAGSSIVASRVAERRHRLNDYVAALHDPRQPLGRSAFEVLSELASLHEVPAVAGPEVNAPAASMQDLDALLATVDRLRASWGPVEEGTSFPWRGAIADGDTEAKRNIVMVRLQEIHDAVVRGDRLDEAAAGLLQLPHPRDPEARRQLLEIGRCAVLHQSGPTEWLTRDELDPHRALLDEWAAKSRRHAELSHQLEEQHGPRWRALDPGLHQRIRESEAALAKLTHSAALTEEAFAGLEPGVAAALALRDGLPPTGDAADRLRSALGFGPMNASLSKLMGLVRIARTSQQVHRPPSSWLSRTRLQQAREYLAANGDAYQAQRQAAARLAERYEPDLLSLDLEPLTLRMRAWHGRRWNRLRPQHRADRAAIVSVTRSRQLPPDVLGDLDAARALCAEQARLLALDGPAHAALGPYAAGLETDVDAAREATEAAELLLTLAPDGTDWTRLAAKAAQEAPYDPEIDRLADVLERLLQGLSGPLGGLVGLIGPGLRGELFRTPTADLKAWLDNVIATLQAVREERDAALTTRDNADLTLSQMLGEADARAEVDRLERELDTAQPQLVGALHDRYLGFASNWPALTEALTWSKEMRAAYPGGSLPEEVAQSVMVGAVDAIDWAGYEQALTSLDAAASSAAAMFDASRRDEVGDLVLGPPESARAFLDSLVSRIDDLATWQALKRTRVELTRNGWGTFVDQAVALRMRADDLHPAVRRSWLEAWFVSLRSRDPRLAEFLREEHDRLVSAFAESDRELVTLGRERVLEAYAKAKPAALTIPGGEQAMVRREAVKKRRHVPVRTLLGAIATLLPTIKPCLMMSPLSVSHFLTPDARFDLVVFDEASQVPPEDAVNCIYRGRQLIVAGDPKQLPPTDFFQLAAAAQGVELLDGGISDYESVLDVCLTMFPQHFLEWHYRSRHDALIAFSNHFIYDDSLVTFPAPMERSDDLGITFVHVPDAVYGRGESRTNPIEASRVMDVVEDHLDRYPGLSIGVIAFSAAQQDAILDERERRLRLRPGLERRLTDGRLDGFFVKNLETVQGDERDIIVFSVGYGRDEDGKITHNFGPINQAGGARRLNVAVTRARRKVVVVSSTRASDIRLGDVDTRHGLLPAGAPLLRAYLEYAEHGQLSTEAGTRGGQEGAGALVRDVGDVVRGLGYQLVESVGTSRYRVDLGVLSKALPGRIALGIECDGRMYQSAKTARDRDRLRGEVLTGLGWRLHRIWSQDWYFNRSSALRRLSEAIESAETAIPTSSPVPPVRPLGGPTRHDQPRGRVEVAEIEVHDALDAARLPWVVPYKPAKVAAYPPTWAEFHDPVLTQEHLRRVLSLVRDEGPIHERLVVTRLSRAFGLGRAGNRVTAAVQRAINDAQNMRAVKRLGVFIWPPGDGTLDRVRVPVVTDPETLRPIDVIPPEEIDLALMRTVEAAMTIERDMLKLQVARVLGFDRTGEKIDETVDLRITLLLRAKRLRAVNGSMALGTGVSLPRLANPDDELKAGMWARHPSLGAGRVLTVSGTIVTLDFDGVRKQIETKVVALTPMTKT
jgi:hypothetical protein